MGMRLLAVIVAGVVWSAPIGPGAARAAEVDIRAMLDLAVRDPARVLRSLEDDRNFPGGRASYKVKIEGLVDVILNASPRSAEAAIAAQILGSLRTPWETNRPELAARRLNELTETGKADARNDFSRALANRSGLYIDASRQDLADPTGYRAALDGYAAMSVFSQTPHALVARIRLALLLAGCAYNAACDVETATATARLPDATIGQPPAQAALALLRELAPLDPQSPQFRLSPGHWRWRNDTAFTLGLAAFLAGETDDARETFLVIRDWPRQIPDYADDVEKNDAQQIRRETPDYRDQIFVWAVLPGRSLEHNRHYAADTVGLRSLSALEAALAAGTKEQQLDAFIKTFDRIENTDNTIIFGSFRSRTQAQNFMDAYQPLLDRSRRDFNGALPELSLEVGAPKGNSAWYSVRTSDTLSDSDVHAVLEALRDTPAFQKVQPFTDRPRVQ